MGRSLANTALIALSVSGLATFTAFCAAFYARERSVKADITLIASLQILSAATGIYSLIPLYSLSLKAGLVDTYLPVILASVNQALPFSCLAMVAFLRRVPDSLFDEARIAGAKAPAIARLIIAPLSIPVIVLVALYSAVNAWNSFTPALILLHSESKFPISLKLFSLAGVLGSSGNRWSAFGATALVNIAILSGLLVLFRRHLSRTRLKDLMS